MPRSPPASAAPLRAPGVSCSPEVQRSHLGQAPSSFLVPEQEEACPQLPFPPPAPPIFPSRPSSPGLERARAVAPPESLAPPGLKCPKGNTCEGGGQEVGIGLIPTQMWPAPLPRSSPTNQRALCKDEGAAVNVPRSQKVSHPSLLPSPKPLLGVAMQLLAHFPHLFFFFFGCTTRRVGS